MYTIGDLISAFDGNTKFAAIIGKNASTASEMKRRNSIPIEYWPRIIKAAREMGIEGVSNDTLVALHLGREVAA